MLETIVGLFNNIYATIINLLPGSPFKAFGELFTDIPYLKYLNWFLPLSEMIAVLQAWVAVIAIFYSYKAILGFIKLL